MKLGCIFRETSEAGSKAIARDAYGRPASQRAGDTIKVVNDDGERRGVAGPVECARRVERRDAESVGLATHLAGLTTKANPPYVVTENEDGFRFGAQYATRDAVEIFDRYHATSIARGSTDRTM